MRRHPRLAIAASVLGLLATPAAAAAHGVYGIYDTATAAPDGHYIVESHYDYYTPPLVEGWGSAAIIYPYNVTCAWSDGTVDDCGEMALFLF
jgi:hypothetical protein